MTEKYRILHILLQFTVWHHLVFLHSTSFLRAAYKYLNTQFIKSHGAELDSPNEVIIIPLIKPLLSLLLNRILIQKPTAELYWSQWKCPQNAHRTLQDISFCCFVSLFTVKFHLFSTLQNISDVGLFLFPCSFFSVSSQFDSLQLAHFSLYTHTHTLTHTDNMMII